MFAGAVVVIASSHSGSAKSTEVTVIVLLYQHFFRSTFWRVLSCFLLFSLVCFGANVRLPPPTLGYAWKLYPSIDCLELKRRFMTVVSEHATPDDI